MTFASETIERAIEALTLLPTIGRKTAQRLVFFLLREPKETVETIANALLALTEKVQLCSTCYNFTDTDPCAICASPRRNRSVICVVESPGDVVVIESTHEFSGLYHVLHGTLNPLEGIGPEDLKIKELLARLDENVQEVILALNPTVEGEVTAQYLSRLIKPLNITVTRIARGVPIGSELEYADEETIARALQGRVPL